MSGNGIRCFAQALAARRGHQRPQRILTDAGPRLVTITPSERPDRIDASVDMGEVLDIAEPDGWQRIGADPYRPVRHLSLGNPHAVVGVEDVAVVDLARDRGRSSRRSTSRSSSPARRPHAITMRVHERGAGITEACGTGACASAWAAVAWGLVPSGAAEILVHMDGGDAKVRLHDPSTGRVTLIGPAERIATVIIDVDDTGAGTPTTSPPTHLPRSHRPPRGTEHHAHMSTPYEEALGATLIERSRPRADRARRRRAAGATDDDTEASLDELALLIDTAGADEAGRLIQRRDAPDHTWFIGKGKVEELRELCLAVDADTVVFDNELEPGPAVQPGEAARAHGARPHRGDPRHLRPERPHARGQGPGRAGPAALPAAAPAARRQGQPVPAGRRRRQPLRLGRDQARGRSPADQAADHQARGRPARAVQHPCAAAQGPGAQRPGQRVASSATPTPASRRCSTGSPRPACWSRTACSPRSTRPPAGCRCPAASRCCSPTPSASSAACRTAWSRRSRARSRWPPTPTSSSTSSTARPPIREGQIAAVRAVLGEIGALAVPELLVFNKADLAPDAAKQLRRRARGLGGHQRADRARASTSCCRPSAIGCVRSARSSSCSIPYDRGDVLAAVHREGEVRLDGPRGRRRARAGPARRRVRRAAQRVRGRHQLTVAEAAMEAVASAADHAGGDD